MSAIWAMAAVTAILGGQSAVSAAEEGSAALTQLWLVDGSPAVGEIAGVKNQTLTLKTAMGQRLHDLADVIAIRFDHSASAAEAGSDRWILFAGGDRAPLSPINIVDDQLVCRGPADAARGNWRVPLQYVTGILFQPLEAPDGSTRIPELSFRQFADDTLILRDGTRLTGVLEDVSPDTLKIETAVGAVSVETARIDAAAFDAALVRMPDSSESSALVVTTDGAWLTLSEWSVDESGELTGRTTIDMEFRCPLNEVVQIRCCGSRVVDLTRRAPIEERVTPFLTRSGEMLLHRNVRGGFLQLDGREYPRGLGMTSGMAVTFPLEAEDRLFRATVGLDDMVGDAGSVVFAVDLDGRRVFTSELVRGSDPAIAVGPLEITGGERLTLSVEFAESGNVQDVADWCDVVIVR